MRAIWMGLIVFAVAGSACAVTDITVFDLRSPPIGENDEVEPGALDNNTWDFEAFTLDGSMLGLQAGFDIGTGNADDGNGGTFEYYTPQGDIFVNLGSHVDAYKPGGFDYDYVIHFPEIPDDDSGSYDLTLLPNGVQYEIFAASAVQTELLNSASAISGGSPLDANNWLWKMGEVNADPIATGLATYDAAYAGFYGTTHYLYEIDISEIPVDEGCAFFYTTQGCANDIIRGKVADGGLTLVLLGLSAVGAAGIRRRLAK